MPSVVTPSVQSRDRIQQAMAWARDGKPAYGHLYGFLEGLFLLQSAVKESMNLTLPDIDPVRWRIQREAGFPMIRRWEFPLDLDGAEYILQGMAEHLPEENTLLKAAHGELSTAVSQRHDQREEFWRSFLHHEGEPWEEWVHTEGLDLASLFFLARNCLRPSLEWTAEELLGRLPVRDDWGRGYCPVCGSLPSMLVVEGEGARRCSCSWCGALWPVPRFLCPACDNRDHVSLGYLYVEAEPQYQVQYCEVCGSYFKQIDVRERLYPPLLPLEELTTLHLDLLAQRAGWKQPPSPSRIVYGEDDRHGGWEKPV